MNGKPYKPMSKPSRGLERYAKDHSGMLKGIDGDLVDLHSLITNNKLVDLVSIETKVMRASGLFPNGFAVVNRGGEVFDGSVVVVRYNGQIIIRRLQKQSNGWFLVPDDPRESVLPIHEGVEIEKLGVVTWGLIKLG